MKTIIYNNHNLNEEDINDRKYRARGLIINSKNEILMGFCENTYQFPGGHLEGNESIFECLKREVREETGLDIKEEDAELFYVIKYYNKDYPEPGINRYTEFSYFKIFTDEHYDKDKMNLDEVELANNFELRYIKLEEFEQVLDIIKENNERTKLVHEEIKMVFQELMNTLNNNNV